MTEGDSATAEQTTPAPAENPGFAVHVGNLPYSVDEARLKGFFEKFGEISAVKVPMNNGRYKGFGFVTFVKQEDADEAIKQMDNFEIDGRHINVAYARGKGYPSGERRDRPYRDDRRDFRRDPYERRDDRRDYGRDRRDYDDRYPREDYDYDRRDRFYRDEYDRRPYDRRGDRRDDRRYDYGRDGYPRDDYEYERAYPRDDFDRRWRDYPR